MIIAVNRRWLTIALLAWVVLACGAGNVPRRFVPLPYLPPIVRQAHGEAVRQAHDEAVRQAHDEAVRQAHDEAVRQAHGEAWHVTASVLADVTGDGVPEWALLVWRPWQDWPIQGWSSAPSPIADYHDAAGESCHLILIDPGDGREIWAGSALPVPLLALAVEDVDGDGRNEVLALEGQYADGRDGPGRHVDVWRWNGFGFTLQWRSPAGAYSAGCLRDADRCGVKNGFGSDADAALDG